MQGAAATLAVLPGVEASTGIRRTKVGELFIRDEHTTVLLEGISIDQPLVSRPIVTTGRYFIADDTDAVILDKNLALDWNIAVGDMVEFLTPKGRRSLTVVGLAINVEKAVYSSGGLALNYVPESLLPKLVEEATQDYGQVGLRLYDENSVVMVWDRAKAAIGDLAFDFTDWRDIRDSTNNLIRINTIFLLAFGLFALLSASLIIAATIGGVVLAQYRTIGLLKAIGFTSRQIILLFVVENVLLGLLGSIGGLAIGLALSPWTLQPVSDALNTPVRPLLEPLVISIVLFSAIGLIILFSLWPARRGGQVSPVQAIQFGSEIPQMRTSRLAQLAIRLKSPVIVVLGIKDVYARPGRTVLTTLNIGLGVVTAIFALGLIATMDRFITDPSLFGTVYDASFHRNPDIVSDTAVQALLFEQPEFLAFYSDTWSQVALDNTETIIFAGFLDGDFSTGQNSG